MAGSWTSYEGSWSTSEPGDPCTRSQVKRQLPNRRFPGGGLSTSPKATSTSVTSGSCTPAPNTMYPGAPLTLAFREPAPSAIPTTASAFRWLRGPIRSRPDLLELPLQQRCPDKDRRGCLRPSALGFMLCQPFSDGRRPRELSARTLASWWFRSWCGREGNRHPGTEDQEARWPSGYLLQHRSQRRRYPAAVRRRDPTVAEACEADAEEPCSASRQSLGYTSAILRTRNATRRRGGSAGHPGPSRRPAPARGGHPASQLRRSRRPGAGHQRRRAGRPTRARPGASPTARSEQPAAAREGL